MNILSLFKLIKPKDIQKIYDYVFKKNDLDKKVEELTAMNEELSVKIEDVVMTCQAIDSKVNEILKIKNKFK